MNSVAPLVFFFKTKKSAQQKRQTSIASSVRQKHSSPKLSSPFAESPISLDFSARTRPQDWPAALPRR